MVLAYKWILMVLWALFWGYWGMAALRTGKTERAEDKVSRLIHLGLVGSAFALVALEPLRIGPMAWNILPQVMILHILGIIIAALGMIFAVWARVHLGSYWSGTITIKADHRLIRSGPYALARHPIYTGLLTGMTGTALSVGKLCGLTAMILIFIAYLRKIYIEETWLVDQFGSEYIQYQREVKAIIPFLI